MIMNYASLQLKFSVGFFRTYNFKVTNQWMILPLLKGFNSKELLMEKL